MIDWQSVDTVLLDMDGTLLDLHFDNFFWLQHLPEAYARKHGLAFAEAKAFLEQRFAVEHGTLNWYCLDYWSQELDVDIVALKYEVHHLIRPRNRCVDFLNWLNTNGKRTFLVTNAHPDSLALKMQSTGIASLFTATLSSHDFGYPKEHDAFWPLLAGHIGFGKEKTLFIDDSIAVLDAARHYGIRHLLCVSWPDSQQPERHIVEYPAFVHFDEIVAF